MSELIICSLWSAKPSYKELLSEIELEEVKKSLIFSTFSFSSMYHSWITKPNKPGQLRAITQPNKKDIIVIDALCKLPNLVFERVFLSYSHGFRKGRGTLTFFLDVQNWAQSKDSSNRILSNVSIP